MDPAERMQALLYYANSAKVAVGLTKRGYSVSPATVSRWANGKGVTPLKVQLVEELLDALGYSKADDPDWGRLQRTVDAIAERVGVTLDEERAVDAAVAELESPPGSGSEADPLEDDRAGSERHGER